MASPHFNPARPEPYPGRNDNTMKKIYVMEYYLTNQSHLFSAPMVAVAECYNTLLENVAIAQKYGYDIISVSEVQGDGSFTPAYIPGLSNNL